MHAPELNLPFQTWSWHVRTPDIPLPCHLILPPTAAKVLHLIDPSVCMELIILQNS